MDLVVKDSSHSFRACEHGHPAFYFIAGGWPLSMDSQNHFFVRSNLAGFAIFA